MALELVDSYGRRPPASFFSPKHAKKTYRLLLVSHARMKESVDRYGHGIPSSVDPLLCDITQYTSFFFCLFHSQKKNTPQIISFSLTPHPPLHLNTCFPKNPSLFLVFHPRSVWDGVCVCVFLNKEKKRKPSTKPSFSPRDICLHNAPVHSLISSFLSPPPFFLFLFLFFYLKKKRHTFPPLLSRHLDFFFVFPFFSFPKGGNRKGKKNKEEKGKKKEGQGSVCLERRGQGCRLRTHHPSIQKGEGME